MLRAIQKRLRNNKGFTLVELIIVIAILGILASIAIPRFSGMTTKAQKKADIATGKSIARAIELAIAEEKVEKSSDSTPDPVDLTTELVNNGYLDGLPKPQYKDYKEGSFTATVDDKGKIVVNVSKTTTPEGGKPTTAVKQVYPTPEDPYDAD